MKDVSSQRCLATAAAASGAQQQQQQQLGTLWRAQEAAMGATLTSPTSSLRSARPPPKHRTVFEAFGIEQPSSASNAGAGAPLLPLLLLRSRLPASSRGLCPGEPPPQGPREPGLLASRAASPLSWRCGARRTRRPAAEGGAGGSLRAGRSFAAKEPASSIGAGRAREARPPTPLARSHGPLCFCLLLLLLVASTTIRTTTAAAFHGDPAGASGPRPQARPLRRARLGDRRRRRRLGRGLRRRPPAARRRRLPTGTPLEELRVRLATSLKRHFHAKRADGLLSTRAARALDTACDAAIDEPSRPLDLWAAVERDVTARWVSRFLAHLALWTRQVNIAVVGKGGGGRSANRAAAARRRRAHAALAAQAAARGRPTTSDTGSASTRTRPTPPPAPSSFSSFSFSSVLTAFRRGLAWPLAKLSRLLLWSLSRLMLVACESAMEMMLALTFAPSAAFAAARSGAGATARFRGSSRRRPTPSPTRSTTS